MKPKILLMVASGGYVLYSLGFLFGQHRGDAFWGVSKAAMYISLAAVIIHVIRYPNRFDAVTSAMKIHALWWMFILFGVLGVERFKFEIWSLVSLILTIGTAIGLTSVSRADPE